MFQRNTRSEKFLIWVAIEFVYCLGQRIIGRPTFNNEKPGRFGSVDRQERIRALQQEDAEQSGHGEYHALLIADEVATGFGRTGTMFACEHERVKPDLMAVSKGLTGGYMPLAATLTTERVYRAFYGRYDEFKTFFHGHSYTGNPLGCAVALANLEVFER